MTTTWNPADEVGCSFALSNHKVTGNSGGNQGCRTVGATHNTNLWYLEYVNLQNDEGTSSVIEAVGFGFASDTLGNTPQIGIANNGDLFATGSFGLGGNVGAIADGNRIGFAINFNTNAFWARRNGGSWVGNGSGGADPVAGINGRQFGNTALFFGMCRMLSFGAPNITINAGDSAFVDSIPSGFTAWDAPPPPFTYGQSRIIT